MSKFIPVVVYNNKKGDNLHMMKFFHEKPFSNPVIHIVDSAMSDILPPLKE